MLKAGKLILNSRVGIDSTLSKEVFVKPEIVVIAGPNGSGKSTITKDLLIKGPYINADDLQRELHITNMEAALLADEHRQQALSRNIPFSFETVLSTGRKLEFLKQAKEKGYFIRGYFILTCEPLLNVARVQGRVLNGGHDVPKDKIISRYEKSLANIPEFIKLCDICHIFDNTDLPARIFRKHKDNITLFENQYWTYGKIKELVFGKEN